MNKKTCLQKLPSNVRSAALATGFLTWVAAGGLGMAYLINASTSRHEWVPDPESAFVPYKNIKVAEIVHSRVSNRAFTGNGYSFVAWKLQSAPEIVLRATEVAGIRNYREWSEEVDAVRFKRTMAFFAMRPEYQEVENVVARVMEAPDMRYLYIHFGASERGVTDAGLWLCSPGMQHLILLESTI